MGLGVLVIGEVSTSNATMNSLVADTQCQSSRGHRLVANTVNDDSTRIMMPSTARSTSRDVGFMRLRESATRQHSGNKLAILLSFIGPDSTRVAFKGVNVNIVGRVRASVAKAAHAVFALALPAKTILSRVGPYIAPLFVSKRPRYASLSGSAFLSDKFRVSFFLHTNSYNLLFRSKKNMTTDQMALEPLGG